MRLRLTVRRHSLPETPVVWNVDLETCTIAQLLEQINDAIPIESGDWGFEDYAVELKGSNGVNYECLHYSVVGKVFKEDDEVIIRPLLTQDIKIRRVSGRNQISSDGKHLVDGLAYGRPLLRRRNDRPPVNIPPLKKRRITYDEDSIDDDDVDDKGLKALKQKEDSAEDPDLKENTERQVILHTDFDDDDSDDDEDFEPAEDDEADEAEESEPEAELSDDEQEAVDEEDASAEMQNEDEQSDDVNEPGLRGVPNSRRAQIRKLHSAFPTSTIAVCKYILDGTEGDLDEAYEAMTIGFTPTLYKGALTKPSQERLEVPKTRSSKRKAAIEGHEEQDSMQVEMDDSINPIFDHYDQNGLPPGSISSGKALSIMAEAMKSSSSRPSPNSKRSGTNSKSVKFTREAEISNGLTSTPFIDLTSQIDDEPEDIASSSEESSSSGNSSSDDESAAAQVPEDTSTSGSDSDDSSSNNPSDSDDAPDETSSRPGSNVFVAPQQTPKPSTKNAAQPPPDPVRPGTGKPSTRSRNLRRRNANLLDRYKKRGILPAGTTISEFVKLKEEIHDKTSPEDASAALAAVRSTSQSIEVDEGMDIAEKITVDVEDVEVKAVTGRALAKTDEFEARRKALLSSIQSGGIDADDDLKNRGSEFSTTHEESEVSRASSAAATPYRATVPTSKSQRVQSKGTNSSASIFPANTADEATSPEASDVAVTAKQNPAINEVLTAPESHQPPPMKVGFKNQPEDTGEALRTPTAAKFATSEMSTELKTPKLSTESAKDSATPTRRSRLNLGAAGRMIFGNLGVKAPKTKSDEDKVRAELMKGVRPLLTPKPVEEAPEAAQETSEDPDAWREMINYRAVECCYDGVVLSEPPFPFEQRWDPQQQYPYSQQGKRGGKRKQDPREQPQYYETQQSFKKQKRRRGKHSYAEQQECLDATYEPSYQDDSMDLSYGEPTQETGLLSDDVEGQINQQLMNDLNEEALVGFSQGPEDLALLPSDLSILPDLQEDQVIPGMTIAFKQLVMGEETGWTPQYSEYRTAIVITTFDNGDIYLQLALRDREQRKKKYDEETGRRIYGRFEMPGNSEDEEEEEEDDGKLNLPFKQLLKAKIVQDAPSHFREEAAVDDARRLNDALSTYKSVALGHDHEEGTVEAQLSHVTETQLDLGGPELLGQEAAEEEQEADQSEVSQRHDPKSHKPDEKPDDESNSPKEPSHQPEEPSHGSNGPYNQPEQAPSPPENENGSRQSHQHTPEPIREDSIEPGAETNPVPNNDSGAFSIPKNTGSPTPAEASPEPVLGENWQEISQLIKDAGFRSNIPSSVTKDIRPEGVQSPSNAAGFEGLMKDMNEIDNNPPYSPKYIGLGSSPTKSPSLREKLQVEVQKEQEDEACWETIEVSSSQPSKRPKKRNSKISKLFKNSNFGKAQEMWEALQPRNQELSVLLGVSNSRQSPDPAVDGTTASKPEITSQVSDHGRQPDINFYDSNGLDTDIPKPTNFDDDSYRPDNVLTDIEPGLQVPKVRDDIQSTTFTSSSKPKVQARKPIIDLQNQNKRATIFSGDNSSSSDGEFPPLERLSQSQPLTKQENSVSLPSITPTKEDKVDRKSMDSTNVYLSEDEQTTPKASQKSARKSLFKVSPLSSSNSQVWPYRASGSHDTPSSPSQSQARPRASQSKISASQKVIDLTQTSSGNEAEANDDEGDSSDAYLKKFRKAESDDSDEDYQDEGRGWVKKRAISQKENKGHKAGGTGLKSSSQGSLNTRHGKKTSRS